MLWSCQSFHTHCQLQSPLGFFEELPERKPAKSEAQERVALKKDIDKEDKKNKRNLMRKEWYQWKKRAKAVGIEPLSAKRPTKGQRKEWEKAIIAAESI